MYLSGCIKELMDENFVCSFLSCNVLSPLCSCSLIDHIFKIVCAFHLDSCCVVLKYLMLLTETHLFVFPINVTNSFYRNLFMDVGHLCIFLSNFLNPVLQKKVLWWRGSCSSLWHSFCSLYRVFCDMSYTSEM